MSDPYPCYLLLHSTLSRCTALKTPDISFLSPIPLSPTSFSPYSMILGQALSPPLSGRNPLPTCLRNDDHCVESRLYDSPTQFTDYCLETGPTQSEFAPTRKSVAHECSHH